MAVNRPKLPLDHPRRAWFDIQGYPPLRVDCSLAFFNDEHRRLLDPARPASRAAWRHRSSSEKRAFRLFLRIDPFLPRDPLGCGKTMADFRVPDVHAIRDLEGLVTFSRELAARHIVYSVAKIT